MVVVVLVVVVAELGGLAPLTPPPLEVDPAASLPAVMEQRILPRPVLELRSSSAMELSTPRSGGGLEALTIRRWEPGERSTM